MTRADLVEALLTQMLSECPPPPRRPEVPDVIADMLARVMVRTAKDILRPLARDIVASGVPFLPVANGKAIICFTCGLVSHNPNDVEQRYCGNCHVFHEK
jgi:hypothetical protein